MVSKKKQEEQQKIEEESKEIIDSMKDGVNSFKHLLADEDGIKSKSQLLKEKLQKEKRIEEYEQKRQQIILQKLRAGGAERMNYLRSQLDYFKFFAYSSEGKQDSILYNYRRKLRSEIQWVIMSQIHYPLICSSILYFITRQLKSGHTTAVVSSVCLGAYVVQSLHNTGARFAFEIAYPAHPLVVERRKRAIEQCCYYHPEIVKFELEYLNKDTDSHKAVFEEGYMREFENEKGKKYQVSVKDSEMFIDCVDDFEDIFEFRKDVLEENQLLDVLAPDHIDAHKSIVDNLLNVYYDFCEEYLRQEYKPDTHHLKKALKKIKTEFEIDEEVFKDDTSLLSKKEKEKQELLLKAYKEIEESEKAVSKPAER